MSGIVEAVSIAANLLTAGLELATKAQQISLLVKKAQMEGRDLTPGEVAHVKSMDDLARGRLDDAIRRAGG